MPAFRYLAEYSRIYVDRSLLVEPGDIVDWPEAPDDGQWEPVDPPSENADGQGDQAESLADEPEISAQAPADSSAPKKTTRRAAPAQNPEE